MPRPQAPVFKDITPQQHAWEDEANTNFSRIESYYNGTPIIPTYDAVEDLPDPSQYPNCLAMLDEGWPRMVLSDGTEWKNALVQNQIATIAVRDDDSQIRIPHEQWMDIPLTGFDRNQIGATIENGDTIALPAGTYRTKITVTYYSQNHPAILRLWDVDNQVAVATGIASPAMYGYPQGRQLYIIDTFTSSESINVVIQIWTSDSYGDIGTPYTISSPQRNVVAQIWKV